MDSIEQVHFAAEQVGHDCSQLKDVYDSMQVND